MDNLHKTITQQFKALDVALEKIEKLDKRTKPKPDEGEVLDRSLHKLRQRYSLLQTARKEAIADYDRQLALLDKQIASLVEQAATRGSITKDIKKKMATKKAVKNSAEKKNTTRRKAKTRKKTKTGKKTTKRVNKR